MTKVSLIFLFIAAVAWVFADTEVVTASPWNEVERLLFGLITPDLGFLFSTNNLVALFNTFAFAFCGIAFGIILSIPLALLFEQKWIQYFCASIRSVHEIFWAFIFLPIVGLNPVCGILAIAIPYAGIFAKVYAEIIQESDRTASEYLPKQVSIISKFAYYLIPSNYISIENYTSYRFECALRSSAILGFIGLPTLGFELEATFSEGYYSQASVLLYAFFLIVGLKKYWLKAVMMPIYCLISLTYLPLSIQSHWQNIVRFFSYDIMPSPIKQALVDGQYQSHLWSITDLGHWFIAISNEGALIGIINTIILTQIVLVGSGIFTICFAPLAMDKLSSPIFRQIHRGIFVVFRTIPEYVLAYIFLIILGPSMLPAILAITIHNGAILSYLMANHGDNLKIEFDTPKQPFLRYIYNILPRTYGQLLAFLFYRWEVMMRESAILGILGIYTLGFYIDSAMEDDKLDRVLVLIILTGVLNILIDQSSNFIRRRFQITDAPIT